MVCDVKPLAIIVMALVLTENAGADGIRIDEDTFRSPPLRLKTIPLWHINGKLTRQEIADQLKAARNASGFSGVAVLPVGATEPKYLTEEYFTRYGDILDICKELGMSVVFYDDVGFPSGTAGGLMKERFPDDVSSRLDMKEWNVDGPTDWNTDLPAGDFMGAVAMNLQDRDRLDVSGHVTNGTLSWQVRAGKWRIMVFTCVRVGQYVDYLNPDAVDRFCSLTYDEYYKRFPEHFGSTITMNFFDDINIRLHQYRNWTPDFNAKFESKHGFSPVKYYPALWQDIGPDTAAARVALFDFRAELLAEGFPRKVNAWCRKHGIRSTGHAMGQYHPQPSFLAGDHIKFYRHCDIPMIDSIHYYGHGRPGFKLTSSASCSYDRPLTAVEIYGNYRPPFGKMMLYRSGMELFARGANLFLPHGMWYDPQRVRIPPLISHFSDRVGPELATYNEWAARSSLLLRGGRHVADIGVLYPVATMQAYARLNKVDGPHPGLTMPDNADFNLLSDLLTGRIRRDFTFLHPEILDEKCRIDGATLRLENKVNFEEYSVIVMPSMSVIHESNLRKIQAFYEAGGKVIATTQLPTRSAEFGHDRDVATAVAAMFPSSSVNEHGYAKATNAAGGALYFVPSLDGRGAALAAALTDAIPAADVRFGSGTPLFTHCPQSGSRPPRNGTHTGMLSYIHKVRGDRNIYFFANSTDESVDTNVTLRGKLSLESWEPRTGEIAPLKTTHLLENGQWFTKTKLALGPVESVFFVETPVD